MARVPDSTSMSLDIAAALAQKLAADYRNGAQWPGMTKRAIEEIQKHLEDALRTTPGCY